MRMKAEMHIPGKFCIMALSPVGTWQLQHYHTATGDYRERIRVQHNGLLDQPDLCSGASIYS
jgi:hypothetical protein